MQFYLLSFGFTPAAVAVAVAVDVAVNGDELIAAFVLVGTWPKDQLQFNVTLNRPWGQG